MIQKEQNEENDSQHYLKILSKSAGQHRRQHEHGAKTVLQQSCGRVWPSLCSSLPWTNHISEIFTIFRHPDRFMQEYSMGYSYTTYLPVQRKGEHRKSNVPHKLDFLRLYITVLG